MRRFRPDHANPRKVTRDPKPEPYIPNPIPYDLDSKSKFKSSKILPDLPHTSGTLNTKSPNPTLTLNNLPF